MSLPAEVTKVLKKAPYDLFAFFVFSVTVVTFSFYLDYDKALHAQLVPYLGWGFSNGYFFPALYIPLMLTMSKASETATLLLLRATVLALMLLQVYTGVEAYLSTTPEDYSNQNPWLRYDALTPIYTIAVPAFWAVLMLVMLGRSFLKNRKEKAKI